MAAAYHSIALACIAFVAKLVTVRGYNLDIRAEAARFMKSPVLQELERTASGSSTQELKPPSFYGYDINLLSQKPSNKSRFMIGSPKMTDPLMPAAQRPPSKPVKDQEQKFKPKGGIHSCPVESSFFNPAGSASPPTCNDANPAQPQPGDGFGTSLATLPNGVTSACSQGRPLNCTADKFSPGYCFNSRNYGSNWEMDGGSSAIECAESTVDVMFVLDGSGSVAGHFGKVKKWVENITKHLETQMRTGIVQVGVVQYSHYFTDGRPWPKQIYIKTEIELGQFRRYRRFKRALNKIRLQNFTTYTGRALQKVAFDFEDSTRFERTKNKQMMFLLTDGKSKDPTLVKPNADALRSMGVETYAVGVKNAVQRELRLIATGDVTSKKRVYSVDDFDKLGTLVNEFKETILNFVLEGSGSDKTVTFKWQFAQTGFSSTFEEKSTNGRLYLGAVGAFDWSGTVTKYDSVDDETPDIPDYPEVQKVLPERTKESYMGYSVTTGYFTDSTTEYVATGAPRYKLMGAVVIYRPIDSNNAFNDHVTIMGNKKQLGSYFGGSVMTADVNNDGKDDLLIGAPLYVQDNFDEGRVFVYISSDRNVLSQWENENYTPLELVGDNLPGGRFGTAMASAGDLNKDGFNDVIIGAPLTDSDRGAVFVYHGSAAGMDTDFKQKILASEMTGVALKYFGQSLQGGVDLDGNQYPDIAVGAPKSDTVVIFRSRPVVRITPEIQFTNNRLDIFECIDKNYERCANLEVCFTVDGVAVEEQIGITFNVTIDTQKVGADKRLEFKSGQENARPTWTEDWILTKTSRRCATRFLNMKRSVKDYDATIIAEVEFELLANHTAQPLSSVRDPSISNKKTATMAFVKNCGEDGKCVYDLRLDTSLNVPLYKNPSGQNIRNGSQVLVIDQNMADTIVKVNLSNHKENAFDTRIMFAYTSLISLSAFTNKIGYPASNSCIVEDSDPVDLENGTKVQVLRYNYKTNIMRQNAWCSFEFSLRIENLKSSGTMDTLWLNVTAYTSDSSSSSEEANPEDNFESLSTSILYRSDFDLKKKKETAQTSFNQTTEAANITSVYEIGNKTTDIEVEFEVSGLGFSNIPQLDASLNYPLKTSSGDRLLYLYKVECTPNEGSKASCTCDESLVNEFNLTLEAPNENNTDENKTVEIIPPTYPIESSSFDCFTKGDKNFTCEMLKCSINNLRQSDQIIFRAYFRLWSSSISFNGTNFEEINLQSRFDVDSKDSNYVIDKYGTTGQSQTREVIWIAKKYKSTVAPEASQDIWIYIVAAIGGLLLLIILVVILWKVGFFKSKYADMKKDAQEEIADETEFANGNGSQVEMAG